MPGSVTLTLFQGHGYVWKLEQKKAQWNPSWHDNAPSFKTAFSENLSVK